VTISYKKKLLCNLALVKIAILSKDVKLLKKNLAAIERVEVQSTKTKITQTNKQRRCEP
jgi:hypothetical protein